MLKTIFLWLTLLSHAVLAQSTSALLGARAGGMGYASATLSDEWSLFNNIAGLANVKDRIVATSLEVRPTLPGGNRMGALLALPFSFGTTGVGVYKFGNDVYSEQMVSLGFANTIGNTSLGAKLSYIQYSAQGFGTHRALGLTIGGITKLTPKISIGAWAQNINQPKLNFDDKEKAPVKLLAAFSYQATEKFLLVTEIEKDILYAPLWKTGMEYIIYQKFFTRAGFNINPNAFFMGIGFKSWRIKIDYAIRYSKPMGLSHEASASYQISSIVPKAK